MNKETPADITAQSNERAEAPELWGGLECTVNRIGDAWHDQTVMSGHDRRLSDLDRFAELGIKALRYPVLWESVLPTGTGVRNFAWADERMARLRQLGIEPIVTLCHHGSGPPGTSLIDPSFAPGLAEHAAAVAKRYPWVRDWTPVNEPLTTARFSALYGYWYPHLKDEGMFWTALLNEIDATRLAMHAIRAVNPEARLVQTDDLGWCHATEPLRCEADFQNERRWMGWDLLCGRVLPGHPLWSRLCGFGLEPRLRSIAADPCPPDVIGVNYYLSSERLLDHRTELHPHRSHADAEMGNCAGLPFVDIDAIRNWRPGVLGLPALLRQAWDRYGLPVAVTECHNGASREEQVRWFLEVWQQAQALRAEGVDLRAVTAWALLGSYDWNRMVTRFAGHYEPGVFDIRSGHPRPTLLAQVLPELSQGRVPDSPLLQVPGWWRRPSRFLDARPEDTASYELLPDDQLLVTQRPLLVVDDDGTLTELATRACELRGLYFVRSNQNLADFITEVRPWGVLDVRDREGLAGPRKRDADHHGARSSVARLCSEAGVRCALLSSAFGPGLAAEGLSLDGVLVVRTGPIYTAFGHNSEAVRMLDTLDSGGTISADAGSPWHGTYGPDVLDTVLDLLLDGVSGPVDLVPRENWSRLEYAQELARIGGSAEHQVRHGHEPDATGRPATVLSDTRRARSLLPIGETTLERFVRECRIARQAGGETMERRGDDTRLQEGV